MTMFYESGPKFTDGQFMDALQRFEVGSAVPDICRELVISTATLYTRRSKSSGMGVLLMARLRELKDENRYLKKMCLE